MNIKQMNDGSYKITVYVGKDDTGKQIRKCTNYHPTSRGVKAREREVQKYALEFEERVKAGRYMTAETMTFKHFSEQWEKDWAEKHLTESTLESYRQILNRDVLPVIGSLKMNRINALHIQQIINNLEKRGLRPATIKRRLVAVNSVFQYAFRMGVIDEDPVNRIQPPKMVKNTDIHYFTLEQAQTFLDALSLSYPVKHKNHIRELKKTGEKYTVPEYTSQTCVPYQWKAYFTLAIYGGFRRGELIALTWNDIDYEKQTVSITKAIAKTKKYGQIIKSTKTVAGIREIMLPEECFSVLREWETEQKKLCMKLGSKWKGLRGAKFKENPVFIQLDSGERMDVDTPSHKFHEIIEMYNANYAKTEEDMLPRIRLHDLRHTSATLLLAYGVDVLTVSHRLGHSEASVTLNVYAHALESMDKKASDTLTEIFSRAQ